MSERKSLTQIIDVGAILKAESTPSLPDSQEAVALGAMEDGVCIEASSITPNEATDQTPTATREEG